MRFNYIFIPAVVFWGCDESSDSKDSTGPAIQSGAASKSAANKLNTDSQRAQEAEAIRKAFEHEEMVRKSKETAELVSATKASIALFQKRKSEFHWLTQVCDKDTIVQLFGGITLQSNEVFMKTMKEWTSGISWHRACGFLARAKSARELDEAILRGGTIASYGLQYRN